MSCVRGRPVNQQQRVELLAAAVDYAVANGFSEVSWRSGAAVLDVSPTALVHHFGTKEEMLVAILGRLRGCIVVALYDRSGEHIDVVTAARWA
jgi:AcrR family transcriptional regulator